MILTLVLKQMNLELRNLEKRVAFVDFYPNVIREAVSGHHGYECDEAPRF